MKEGASMKKEDEAIQVVADDPEVYEEKESEVK